MKVCSRNESLRKGWTPQSLNSTLAWPGWKQPDIPVEVDTARLETSRFKNGLQNVYYFLLYYPSSEFKSVVNVYWHGEGAAAGLSCTELSIPSVSFLLWGGAVCSGGIVLIPYCVNGMPQKDTLDSVAYTCMLLYSIDVFHLGFNFLCLLLL